MWVLGNKSEGTSPRYPPQTHPAKSRDKIKLLKLPILGEPLSRQIAARNSGEEAVMVQNQRINWEEAPALKTTKFSSVSPIQTKKLTMNFRTIPTATNDGRDAAQSKIKMRWLSPRMNTCRLPSSLSSNSQERFQMPCLNSLANIPTPKRRCFSKEMRKWVFLKSITQ